LQNKISELFEISFSFFGEAILKRKRKERKKKRKEGINE
jgi:hypothetical protein